MRRTFRSAHVGEHLAVGSGADGRALNAPNAPTSPADSAHSGAGRPQSRWWPLALKMAKMSVVGRPAGRIWRVHGTLINTGPTGEVYVDVCAAESAQNVLNGRYGGKTRPFWLFFEQGTPPPV